MQPENNASSSATQLLSVFIITFNEADRIEKAIQTVQSIADEIIVVDSGSNDGTQEKATAMGAKIIHNDWCGYGPQKRFAEDQCTHNWLLNLDADEWLTEPLVKEIKQLLASSPSHQAYRIKRPDLLPWEDTPPSFAHAANYIRLYNKQYARFAHSPVHDEVQQQKGTTGQLQHLMYHRHARSLSHMIQKLNNYSTMQVEDLSQRNKYLPGWRLYLEFPAMFFKAYFIRRYCLRGRGGFILSMIYAISRFTRVAKWEEIKQKTSANV